MNRKLPKSLLQKQESERNATITVVTNAIIELESQGYNTRIKDLMFVTGLSRSVFAKPHIRRILVEYSIVKPGEIDKPTSTNKRERDTKTILAEKDGYIDRLLLENERLRQEVELLRGQMQLLMHKTSFMNDKDF